ncbi:hypothetical protein NU195Hw_Modified_130t1 [Hortaea werneckii]
MDLDVPTPMNETQKTRKMLDLGLAGETTANETTPHSPKYNHTQSLEPSIVDNCSMVHSQASYLSHATTDESQTPFKREPSINPSERLAELGLLEYPVHRKAISLPTRMPESLRLLTRTMRKIEKGEGIIPQDDKTDELRGWLADEEDEDDCNRVVSSNRAECGSVPDLMFALNMEATTMEMIEGGCSDADWNCSVHYPILAEACERSVASQHIRVRNITTASIADAASNTTRQADFAITFDISDAAKAALSKRGIESLSHSNFQPLCYSPPAVIIAARTDDTHGQEVDLQLRTWAYAHVMNLRALLHKVGRPQTPIPGLPLLEVQGGRWHFSYLEIRFEMAVVWSQVAVGDVSTVRGVYQILTALQKLVEWITTTYEPWFLENIVKPLIHSPK